MIFDYLEELKYDIYPQPEDEGHARLAKEVVYIWSAWIKECKDMLDVGCGVAFVQPMFEALGVNYLGICLGSDYDEAMKLGRRVVVQDFHNLDFSVQFDFIFSRHSLEHSPMPLLALMEWHRVCSKYLGLVLPNPDYYGWGGKNHYSVMNEEQTRFLLDRSGWEVLDFRVVEHELRFLCKKVARPIPFYKE